MKDKKDLTEQEKEVMHDGGTEQAFTGQYWNHHDSGVYRCNSCGQVLFKSDTKIDSSQGPVGLQGWPAFDTAVSGAIEFKEDDKLGMVRTEAVCSQCGVHLGHLFDDKETATGKHYCINSCSLEFTKNEN